MRNAFAVVLISLILIATESSVAADDALTQQFADLQPLLREYCFDCHSTDAKEGELDLERFSSLTQVQEDLKPWQAVILQLETSQMPPDDQPQPTAAQRRQLIDWTRRMLHSEAMARAGERGNVPLHRLSNTEYNNTIRDLTQIDFQPTRDFPADGASGEGFTNAAQSLSMSPALMAKYINAAKDIANHVVLLPTGFRFSASLNKRDWTDESLGNLRKFYHQFTPDGSLPLKPYLAALVANRSGLQTGDTTLNQVAVQNKLSAKYLQILWQALNDDVAESFPLQLIRTSWKSATANDVDAMVAEVAVWFDRLWDFPRIGSYVNSHRQIAKQPTVIPGQQNEFTPEGLAEFRRIFPPNICYPHIIPLDEVVCLKTYHREDGPLIELFLDDAQIAELEQLWQEHRFISRFPLVENEYLPLFIGFVTQDQPQELVKFFEDKRPTFQAWADQFERDFEQAAPLQIAQLLTFASRAYRRPLTADEAKDLQTLYLTQCNKGVGHEDAFRSLLVRVLVSPSFLMHLEQAPAKPNTPWVNDWELASRLSYFLWATMPDEELRQLAASGQLHQPAVLAQQTRRMLQDDRVRALAIEFGTQWIHVRGFDQFNEKNDALFPMFDSQLRTAMYEEAVLFFQDLFQNDGRAVDIIDADYTFMNQTLAEHYGLTAVTGESFQRVDDIKKMGRGGVLGFASVQTKQAGSSRTSPVLRGNWVVETLLGENLPLPPPNVPLLPESEIGNGGLTMREIVVKHVSAPECATCHQRIDPFGLALEHYDPIGRRRQTDLGGLPVDATATLRDGTRIEGLEGLRDYLLTNHKTTIMRLFYQRLVGYSLGREVSISDQRLIDQMMDETHHGEGGITNAVIAIVQSPQFRRTTDSPVSQ